VSDAHEIPRLFEMADLITPMAIRVAATLRIADRIEAGACTATALAGQTATDAAALTRVLDHLVTIGVLAGDAGGYALTELGTKLRDDDPSHTRAWLDTEGAVGHADLALVHLLETTRTGQPAYPLQFGRGFWDDLDDDARLDASFHALMSGRLTDAPVVARAYDWGSLGHLIDVAGGDGALLAAILHAHPALSGTVLERPSVVADAERRFDREGLAGRAVVVAGSFFERLPPGGSYLLSGVVHDWDDEHAAAILSRCAEGLGTDGRVVIIESLDEAGGPDARHTHMDLRMLAYCGGRERSLHELTALAAEVGLELRSHASGSDVRSIVELAPGGTAKT
jgi:2,7-dihydroxy-5-methyl-1-naphthoate 7-O-methyltransferase